jgi:hypothetical protein
MNMKIMLVVVTLILNLTVGVVYAVTALSAVDKNSQF